MLIFTSYADPYIYVLFSIKPNRTRAEPIRNKPELTNSPLTVRQCYICINLFILYTNSLLEYSKVSDFAVLKVMQCKQNGLRF